MGMFDNVNYKANCWKCGKPLSGFQTKDGERLLMELEPKQIAGGSFYASCFSDKCRAWNEFDVITKDYEIVFNEKQSKLRTS